MIVSFEHIYEQMVQSVEKMENVSPTLRKMAAYTMRWRTTMEIAHFMNKNPRVTYSTLTRCLKRGQMERDYLHVRRLQAIWRWK